MSLSLEGLRTVIDSSASTSAPMSLNQSLPPTRWYESLAQYQQQGVPHVLATVVAVNGSAPRALQAKMIVTQDSICDTLGGGGLEHDVTTTARQLLSGELAAEVVATTDKLKKANSEKAKAIRREAVYTKHYPLGAKLAQCCGGSVTVMFECFNLTPPLSLLVFGAGHVASALMTILAELPCQVDWVDSRSERFERYLLENDKYQDDQPSYCLPAHIRPHVDYDPVDFIQPFIRQRGQRFILVMTHDHSLDFDLVRAALDSYVALNVDSDSDSNDAEQVNTTMPYIGCISSATKAKRFKDRLLQRGYDQQLVDQITMPIGFQIGGKEPMAVAVSIAAQILQHYHNC